MRLDEQEKILDRASTKAVNQVIKERIFFSHLTCFKLKKIIINE